MSLASDDDICSGRGFGRCDAARILALHYFLACMIVGSLTAACCSKKCVTTRALGMAVAEQFVNCIVTPPSS
jgi:hypothetical protein